MMKDRSEESPAASAVVEVAEEVDDADADADAADRTNFCDRFPCHRSRFKAGFTSFGPLLIPTPFVYSSTLSSSPLVMGFKVSLFGE
jgi:hypothetical protein